MTSATEWRPTADLTTLREYARLRQAVREFFAGRGVLEVTTPILGAAGNCDRHVEPAVTTIMGSKAYLRTSPEHYHKRLLAAGSGAIFEMGPVVRDGEQGASHNPEFTMLEWYRPGWSDDQLATEVIEVLHSCAALWQRSFGVEHIDYVEACSDATGFDVLEMPVAKLARWSRRRGFAPEVAGRDEYLDFILSHAVTRQFESDCVVVVTGFPATQAAQAVVDGQLARRFEVFWGSMELANGYLELTDGDAMALRFASELEARSARGDVVPPVDLRLLSAMKSGLPPCAGVALGLDRLMMLLLEFDDISAVMSFAHAVA